MRIGSIEFPIWTPKQFAEPDALATDFEFITAPMPKVLWIELTSKCPFDCIFCTRRVRFGGGQHLDFDVYRRLIAELEKPDFIGLNYSGESIYYPKLLDAISLATATGATTEVVSAFSSITPALLRGIAESGLDRLAISLHTMDPVQYQKIYKFGSLDLLKRRVAELVELKIALGVQKPRLDFCFVAMSENLDQLPAVTEYARSVGARELSIHPIIGRHLVPHDFSQELQANQLREGFKNALRSKVAAVRNTHPGIALNVLNPDLDSHPRLSHTPGYYSPALPEGARIYSCDQSPFESVHILASGNVVVCEVHDEVSFGDLHQNSLRDIWAGDRYRDFRKRYVTGSVPECRSCVWKLAYLPGPLHSRIVIAEGMTPQLMRGWHSHDGSDLIWSKKNAVLALGNPGRKKRLRIAGALPPSSSGEINSLHLSCNRVPMGSIQNATATICGFDEILDLPHDWDRLYLDISTSHLFRPSLHSSSGDSRDLGAGISRIEVRD